MNKPPVRAAIILLYAVVTLCCFSGDLLAASPPASMGKAFPPSLESYQDGHLENIGAVLIHRIRQEPFNLFATLIFFLAILHTFLTGKFMAVAHKWEREHQEKIRSGEAGRDSVSHRAELFHFLGEVEAVFGIWAAALVLAIIFFYDWDTAVNYISYKVNFTEALFVVVIMTLAATRPILRLSDRIIRNIANLMGGSLTARWMTTLTIGPLLGSFITEPAAMTISALVLSKNLYDLEPSGKLKYATLGLLFVNISVGGTLTHFAAPPVLMVADPWKWTTLDMLTQFGWKAVVGILLSNGLYLMYFLKEIKALEEKFSLVSLKEEIQETYVRRSDMDAMFDQFARESRQEAGTASCRSFSAAGPTMPASTIGCRWGRRSPATGGLPSVGRSGGQASKAGRTAPSISLRPLPVKPTTNCLPSTRASIRTTPRRWPRWRRRLASRPRAAIPT